MGLLSRSVLLVRSHPITLTVAHDGAPRPGCSGTSPGRGGSAAHGTAARGTAGQGTIARRRVVSSGQGASLGVAGKRWDRREIAADRLFPKKGTVGGGGGGQRATGGIERSVGRTRRHEAVIAGSPRICGGGLRCRKGGVQIVKGRRDIGRGMRQPRSQGRAYWSARVGLQRVAVSIACHHSATRASKMAMPRRRVPCAVL